MALGSAFQPDHLKGASVILASGDIPDQFPLAAIAQAVGVPLVYIIEYSLETRRQIADVVSRNRLTWVKNVFFLWWEERRRRKAFSMAAGLQCNGVDAHHVYGGSASPLLYFDTRARKDSHITVEGLEDRLAALEPKAPLRLAYSGRLTAIKGTDHLIPFAQELVRLGVNFTLTIYGAGDQAEFLREEVSRLGLATRVTLAGAVDFDDVLLPTLRSSVDLALMLHRQGDPSCTYLETLSCGVPILGYSNKNWDGLLRRAPVGWSSPMNDPQAAAAVVADLAQDLDSLKAASRSARAFSAEHTFEATFEARIQHLVGLARRDES